MAALDPDAGAAVAELPAGERAAVAHDREREPLGAQSRAARERFVEPLGAVELAAAARLDDPVGEEDDALALAERRVRLLVALAGLDAEREAGCGERPHAAVGAHEPWRRVTCAFARDLARRPVDDAV